MAQPLLMMAAAVTPRRSGEADRARITV